MLNTNYLNPNFICIQGKFKPYFCFLIFVLYKWFGAVVFESRNNRGHSFLTQQGIRYGMVLFILSEVMFLIL